MTSDMQVYDARPPATRAPDEMSADDVIRQMEKIQEIQRRAMKDGEHFGVIPGTNSKPTLLNPGAQKLLLTFRLRPDFEGARDPIVEGAHRTWIITCALYHITTGNKLGEGVGMCSTKEAKYAYRKAEITCPQCGAQAVIKGKAEFGGGWLCFKKKGGCGGKFADNDLAITAQPRGRVANPDLPDVYNTVLKIAKKRALVDAVLTCTAASDCFTQDLEDEGQHDTRAEVNLPIEDAFIEERPPQFDPEAEKAAVLTELKKLADKAFHGKAPELRASFWKGATGHENPKHASLDVLLETKRQLQALVGG